MCSAPNCRATNVPARLGPREPTGQPIEQPVHHGRPPAGPYAVTRGHRLII